MAVHRILRILPSAVLLLHGCGVAAQEDEAACADDGGFRDESGFSCSDWQAGAFVCEDAASEHSYSQESQAALLAACPLSCGVCEDPNAAPNECADVPGYTSTDGTGCAEWLAAESVCTESGLSDDSQQLLQDSCPLSCGLCVAASEDLCTDDSVFRE